MIRISLFLVTLLTAVSQSIGQEAAGSGRTTQPSILVGAYYYPWYRAPKSEGDIGWMKQALRGRLEPRQLPRLGVYDSRDPEVIRQHIAQSVKANIHFWALSWWGPNRGTDQVIRENILTHPDASRLKYALLYESTGRLGSFANPSYRRLLDDFQYMADHYFERPDYLKIDGKPVVFVYLTRVYFRNKGGEALEELRAKCPKLYLIGDEVFGDNFRAEHAQPWDAVTAYDVYGQSLQGEGATQKALTRLNDIYRSVRDIAAGVGRAFVPAVSPGFNDRAVREGHAGRPRYFTDEPDSREGDVFRRMIRDVALANLDARTGNMIMVTSFNEWYEDTQIEATAGTPESTRKDDSSSSKHYTEGDRYSDYGSLYLEILREETAAGARK